jgi:hypothetical protein
VVGGVQPHPIAGEMFDFDWLDLLSLHTVLAAIGWAMAIGMAIHHLNLVEPHRVRSTLLIALCVVGVLATLVEGGRDHKEARVVRDGIENIQRTINAENAPPTQILAEANDRLVDIQDSIRRLSITPPPSAGRHLSDSQIADLVTTLRPFSTMASKVDLSCSMGDARGCIYADQWMHVLRDAGWSVNGVGQAVFTPAPPLGVYIEVNNAEMPGAAVLQRALSSVGTQATGRISVQVPPNTITLIVGAE